MTDLPTYQLVAAYVQGYAIQQALVKANSLNKEEWNQALFKTQFNSFWGPVALDNVGHNYAKEWITVQVTTESAASSGLMLAPLIHTPQVSSRW